MKPATVQKIATKITVGVGAARKMSSRMRQSASDMCEQRSCVAPIQGAARAAREDASIPPASTSAAVCGQRGPAWQSRGDLDAGKPPAHSLTQAARKG